VELSDESGIVKNLRNFPTDYGVEYLKEREILILLKVDSTYTLTCIVQLWKIIDIQ